MMQISRDQGIRPGVAAAIERLAQLAAARGARLAARPTAPTRPGAADMGTAVPMNVAVGAQFALRAVRCC
jgi:hypothetical protein